MREQWLDNEKGIAPVDLLVIALIVGFLAAAVLVASDPVKRNQDSRDAERYSEVNGILNAILAKQVDDGALFDADRTGTPAGNAPVIEQGLGTNVQVIVEDDAGIVCNAAATRPGCRKAMDTTGANKDCVARLADPTVIPRDPVIGTPCRSGSGCTTEGDLPIGSKNSGYYIARTAGDRIEIGSCNPEQATFISIRR